MDDDLVANDLFGAFLNSPHEQPHTPNQIPFLGNVRGSGSGDARFVEVEGELVYISDDDEPIAEAEELPPLPTSPAIDLFAVDRVIASVTAFKEEFTSAQCLKRVLEIFPDINHEYVRTLYSAYDEPGDYEVLSGSARFDSIIEQLLETSSYPKQEKDRNQKKRKRERSSPADDDDDSDDDDAHWTSADRRVMTAPCHVNLVRTLLKAEFPEMPVAYIGTQYLLHRHVYQTFVALAHARDTFDPTKPAFSKGRPSTKRPDAAYHMAESSGVAAIKKELDAARRHVQRTRAQRAAEDAKNHAELDNARHAKEAGDVTECSACFDEVPLNRQIHCEGEIPHFTCYDCAMNYIRSEVGQSRCRVLCTAGCGARFAPAQMNLLSNKSLLAKLADLEQQKAIRDAGLEDLEECPFCDFKAEMPPIEENFEFRCLNPECEKISCRRCRLTSHIPVSCARYEESLAKDNQLAAIHKIEEAMTEALMRSCNNCKTHFIKEYGCNKMTCPSCSNVQCYVCSATLKNYDHFDSSRPGERAISTTASKKCPLFDNVEERHSNEVKEAEARARADIMEQVPDMNPNDLTVKMSDAVVKAEADRIKKAAVNNGEPPPALHQYPLVHPLDRRVVLADRIPERNVEEAVGDYEPLLRNLERLQRVVNADEARNMARRIEMDAARARVQRLHHGQRRLPHVNNIVHADPAFAHQAELAANAIVLGRPPHNQRLVPDRALPLNAVAARFAPLRNEYPFALPQGHIPPLADMYAPHMNFMNALAGNADLGLHVARLRQAQAAAAERAPVRPRNLARPEARAPHGHRPGQY